MNSRVKLVFGMVLVTFVQTHTLLAKELIQESKLQLFDIGLAHINGDAFYDIYTANHGFAESVLLNEGGGFPKLTNVLNDLMIDGSAAQEMNGEIPKFKQGLNIFRPDDSLIFLFCNECESTVNGQVIIPKAIVGEAANSIVYSENASAKITELSNEGDKDLIAFILEKNALLVLKRKYVSVAMNFEIEYQPIYIGPKHEKPESSKFSLISRDNHTFAWTRLNNDLLSDVFVGSGGLKGQIKNFDDTQILNDMLLVSNPEQIRFDSYSKLGFNKNTCRSYSSMWVDVDSDSDLDLYVGCENDKNQLFLQQDNGEFLEQAEKYGLDFKHGSVFKWQDWNHDGLPDIVLIQKNKLSLYLSQLKSKKTKFRLIKASKPLGIRLQAVNSQIKITDLNNDNLLDVFVTSAAKQHYFIQDGASFKKARLGSLGLPQDTKGFLSVVDVNLDGLLDICLFEGGIYLQNDQGRFEISEILKESFSYKSAYHKFENEKSILWFRNYVWFDKENDGSWDVLEAGTYRYGSRKERREQRKFKVLSYDFERPHQGSKVYLHEAIKRDNNWLQIDLTGPVKNLDAIGSLVKVQTADRIQNRHTYGASDSFHSQGHYRHYFGLNKNDNAKVTIIWPDGKQSVMEEVKANQLLKINYPH